MILGLFSICLVLAFCWRSRYHIFCFLYICTTEFLLNFSLSFLSVALVFRQFLYNNHNNQIGLAGSPNLFNAEPWNSPRCFCKENDAIARVQFLSSPYISSLFSSLFLLILFLHLYPSHCSIYIIATAPCAALFTSEPTTIPTYQVRLHHHQNFCR